jgi:hypothetical protein
MQSRVFTHPQRDRIDRELLAGVGYRTISAWSGVSIGALSRYRVHLKQTLGLALKDRTPGESAEHGTVLLARVQRLVGEAEEILATAKTDKNFTAATSALNAACRLLELCGRLDGSLSGANTPGLHLTLNKTTTINNYDAGSDEELATLIFEATKGYDADEIARLKALANGHSSAIINV